MMHCKPINNPINTNEKLYLEDGSRETNPSRYRRIVGSLLYLTHTRPDLMFAVGLVSRFMKAPTILHFGAVKRILYYISGTLNFGLCYTHSEKFDLIGYTDSDWGRSQVDRRSTTGWAFFLGSTTIAWCSKKQPITGLSSTEVEYVSATSAACEAVWLRRLLDDLNEKVTGPTIIHCDNKSAISITKNPSLHGRTKHIGTRFHFIHDLIGNGDIDVVYCKTDEQVADVFTKALPCHKFEAFRDALGVRSF